MTENTEQIVSEEISLPAVDFPIVGIGASAGGLAAFEAFFSAMPIDTPSMMAFVLVQHLDPDHKSILTSLIQSYTRMEVFEAEDGMVIKQNCAYIIAPGYSMGILKGKLTLSKPLEARGQRLPIDFFFQSLALDQQEKAVGIILSGNGNDGVIGIQAIKTVSGLVMVQKPESADYNSMPLNAINTGIVDYELLPSEMPAKLVSYVKRIFIKLINNGEELSLEKKKAMEKLFTLLRTQTGHDFSQYKTGTIYRRIDRRMSILQITSLEAYSEYLQDKPNEVEILFRDLLISVTYFFRDPEIFTLLEERIIPNLFLNKPPGCIIRVWVAGCATGEEAYSIAILIKEYLEKINVNFKFQIFATDIDSRAIAFARAGIYPANFTINISPERLRRFFIPELSDKQFRIHKSIRDQIVFSEQDLIKDPPFSKLDLISCRNLLIYLGGNLQKRLIPLFHYALSTDGVLLLGTSETIGGYNNLFTTIDRKWKFYQKKNTFQNNQGFGVFQYLPPVTRHPLTDLKQTSEAQVTPRKIPLRELTEKTLLKQLTPPSVLVNSHGDILYIHGHTGMYLEPSIGEPGVNNILKMARQGLLSSISSALDESRKTKKEVYRFQVKVKTNGHSERINLSIRPIVEVFSNASELLFLISFEKISVLGDPNSNEIQENLSTQNGILEFDKDSAIDQIFVFKQELAAKEYYLQYINEELETSNQELKSSNEEMQSVNEELQSANEELETSKEEIQSINEELITVNSELQMKLADLSRVNNDMNNLLSGTGIATIFVDFSLNILRFTPTAMKIINFIPADVGRPIGHILSNLVNYDSLIEDTQMVLNTLIPREAEVQTKDNKWYALRISPYRTTDNIIEGAVITFVEITQSKQLEKALQIERVKLDFQSNLLKAVGEAVIATDLNGSILYWNLSAEEMYGWKSEEVIGQNIIYITPTLNNKEQAEEIMNTLRAGKAWSGEFLVNHRDGHSFFAWVTNTTLTDEMGKISVIIGVSKDITDRKNDEKKIKDLLKEKEIILREVHHRIKNNMNQIFSLLSLQSRLSEETKTTEALEEAANRVHSMMLLYDKLYRSPTFQEISVKDYLPQLVDEILANFVNRSYIVVEKNIGDFVLDVKRLQPLGIIINELLTNIMKYAFFNKTSGLIRVTATLENNLVSFIFEDNGNGMPDSVNFESSTGFGLMLIQLLTQQLKGTIRIERENGTKVILEFDR